MAVVTNEYTAGEALRIFGGLWIVASDGVPTRYLGGVKPPMVGGRTILDSDLGDGERRDLGEAIRLPADTPRPGQSVEVATAEEFLSKGLRIVRTRIVDVAFTTPPRHLANATDAVAASVRIEGIPARVPVRHDASGCPSLCFDPGPFGPWPHLASACARAAAAAFAERVVALADWTARQS